MKRILLLCALFVAGDAHAQDLSGRWQGRIVGDSVQLTFPIAFASEGGEVTASFFNGDQRVNSTGSQWRGDSLLVEFAHLASTLRVELKDGALTGSYGRNRRTPYRVEIRPEPTLAGTPVPGPAIAGTWYIPTESPKGEHAWRLVVQQEGGVTTATILRVDGDAGAHVGSFAGDRFLLNHFDGARASQLQIIPRGDSVIVRSISARGTVRSYIGLRPAVALARGLPAPADFSAHTGVKDPDEPFHFSFPDLAGQVVANSDPRFAGKVVIVNIGGSWCPNCHDEAPFLAELYAKYRGEGLEVVMLDFEEADELANPRRLPAFIERHGIDYPVLLGGQPDELNSKIPQATNLNSWPTTFFLGRDGKVAAVRAGFAAKASGEFHDQLRSEYVAVIEELLAKP